MHKLGELILVLFFILIHVKYMYAKDAFAELLQNVEILTWF